MLLKYLVIHGYVDQFTLVRLLRTVELKGYCTTVHYSPILQYLLMVSNSQHHSDENRIIRS